MTKSPFKAVITCRDKGEKVKLAEDANAARPRALIELKSNSKLVNAELVREGFARPIFRGRDATEKILPGFIEGLVSLQKQAKSNGSGMYKRCELVETAAEDQFEPLDLSVETQYGDDGGKQMLRLRDKPFVQPTNPGDVRMFLTLKHMKMHFDGMKDISSITGTLLNLIEILMVCHALVYSIQQTKMDIE